MTLPLKEYIKNVRFATTIIHVIYNAISIGIHHVHKHENQCQVFKTTLIFMFGHVEYKLDKILNIKTLYLMPCIGYTTWQNENKPHVSDEKKILS